MSDEIVVRRFKTRGAEYYRETRQNILAKMVEGRSRFLHKHLADVARFYKRISKMEHLSAAALKLKARLDKDRDKLFTFLSHDGIPWNNNNAEHAIKAFARLGKAIEGLSTPGH
jgi:Transposase IS66 family